MIYSDDEGDWGQRYLDGTCGWLPAEVHSLGVLGLDDRCDPSILTVTAILGAPPAAAQSTPSIELPPPDVASRVQFTLVTTVRELHDGSLLVTDRVEPRLVHMRWESSEPTAIGRRGGGPGEYQGSVRLFPLAGDSSLLTDSHNGRWSLMDGPQIATTVSEHRPLNRMLSGNLVASDTLGHVLGVRGYAASGYTSPHRSAADSLVVILAEWMSERVDTIARIKGPGSTVTTLPPRGGRPITVVANSPLSAPEQAFLFADGWIAIARQHPCRVDWRTPHGQWIRGARLPGGALG